MVEIKYYYARSPHISTFVEPLGGGGASAVRSGARHTADRSGAA